MSGGGSKPGERRGGRQLGAKNKTTIERENQARLEVDRARMIDEARAANASEVVTQAKAAGVKLAKDILEDFMRLFAGMAAIHQPLPDGVEIPPGRKPDPEKFLAFAKLAVSTASDLAPYQSPKLSAVMVGAAVVTEIEIVGGLPDEEDGGLYAAEDPAPDPARLAGPGPDPGQGGAADVPPPAGGPVSDAGETQGGPLRKALG